MPRANPARTTAATPPSRQRRVLSARAREPARNASTSSARIPASAGRSAWSTASARQGRVDAELRRPLPGIFGRALGGRVEQTQRVLVFERRPERQHGIQDGAQAPDIARAIHPVKPATGLLGAHPAWRPDDRPVHGAGHRDLARRSLPVHQFGLTVQHPGDAPVHDDDLAVGPEHDVVGLEIPVHHAPPVGVGDGLADLQERGQQPVGGPGGEGLGLTGSELVQDVPQRATAHQLHDEEELAVGADPQVVHRHDVGVVELSGNARLGHEPGELTTPRAVGIAQGLDGHGPAKLGVQGLQDHAHAPAAQGASQGVASQAAGDGDVLGRLGTRRLQGRRRSHPELPEHLGDAGAVGPGRSQGLRDRGQLLVRHRDGVCVGRAVGIGRTGHAAMVPAGPTSP